MREIKFRACLEFEDGFKLMVNPVTVYPEQQSIGFSYDLIADALEGTKYTIEEDGIYWADKDHYDIMYALMGGEDWFWDDAAKPVQYIGFKDKNGKDIYESDVVEIKHPHGRYKGEIIVDKTLGAWTGKDFMFPHFDIPWLLFSEGTKYIEVIGNIYEHEHLLK